MIGKVIEQMQKVALLKIEEVHCWNSHQSTRLTGIFHMQRVKPAINQSNGAASTYVLVYIPGVTKLPF